MDCCSRESFPMRESVRTSYFVVMYQLIYHLRKEINESKAREVPAAAVIPPRLRVGLIIERKANVGGPVSAWLNPENIGNAGCTAGLGSGRRTGYAVASGEML